MDRRRGQNTCIFASKDALCKSKVAILVPPVVNEYVNEEEIRGELASWIKDDKTTTLHQHAFEMLARATRIYSREPRTLIANCESKASLPTNWSTRDTPNSWIIFGAAKNESSILSDGIIPGGL